MNYIYPITNDGYLLFDQAEVIEATDEEIEELKSKHLVSYYYNYDTGGGQWEYLVDNLNEIEEYLELIRTPEYKAANKYNL